MSASVLYRRYPAATGPTFWICGVAVGLVGGFATLTISPLAAVPELLLWLWLALPRLRGTGLAGALIGHGAAWAWLLVTSHVSCVDTLPARCYGSLAYGPSHAESMAAWQSETWVWFAVGVGLILFGAILTTWTVLRTRSRIQVH